MHFLSPLALAGLALIALPIVIHLLVRRRAGWIDFPSLRFLRETPSFRLRPRRIQQPLLLALRVAAIALLALGLARPLFTFGSGTNRLRVIVLDSSLSMNAAGRTEAAKETAQNLVEKLQPGERAAVVAVGSTTVTVAEMTSDKKSLIDAIKIFALPPGRMSYSEGLARVNELLEREPHPSATIDIISDFQQTDVPTTPFPALSVGAISAAQIAVHPVGAPIERNAFIVDESVTAEKDGPVVHATETTSAKDGRTGVRRVWKINSREGSLAGIEWRSQQNGDITARIRSMTADEFDWDDDRFLIFTPPRSPRVLLVEPGPKDESLPYFVAAFEAAGNDLASRDLAVDRKSSLTGLDTANYGLIALMLPNQPRADEIRLLAEYAANGGTVWFSLGRDADTSAWNQFLSSDGGAGLPISNLVRTQPTNQQPLRLSVVDNEAPALRHLGARSSEAFSSVRMLEGFSLAPRNGAATSVRWNDGSVALVEAAVGRGRIVIFGASPARTSGDLGTSPTFPALVSSIARTAFAPVQSLFAEVGEPIDLRLKPETDVRVFDEFEVLQTAKARELLSPPIDLFMKPGIYRIEAEGVTRVLALNQPATESEIQLASPDQIQRAFSKPTATPQPKAGAWYDAYERKENLWRYLLLAAFLVLMAESILAMRTFGQKR